MWSVIFNNPLSVELKLQSIIKDMAKRKSQEHTVNLDQLK